MSSPISLIVGLVEQFFCKVLLEKVKGDQRIISEWHYFHQLLLHSPFDFHRIQTYLDLVSHKQSQISKKKQASYSVHGENSKRTYEGQKERYSDLPLPQSPDNISSTKKQEIIEMSPHTQHTTLNKYTQQPKQTAINSDSNQKVQKQYCSQPNKLNPFDSQQVDNHDQFQTNQSEEQKLKKYKTLETEVSQKKRVTNYNNKSGKIEKQKQSLENKVLDEIKLFDELEKSGDFECDNSDEEGNKDEKDNNSGNDLLLLIEKKYFDCGMMSHSKQNADKAQNSSRTALSIKDLQNTPKENQIIEQRGINSTRSTSRNRIVSTANNGTKSSNDYSSSQSNNAFYSKSQQSLQSKEFNPSISQQNNNYCSQNQTQSSINQTHSQQTTSNLSYNTSSNHQQPLLSLNQDSTQLHSKSIQQESSNLTSYPKSHLTQPDRLISSSSNSKLLKGTGNSSGGTRKDNYNFHFKISPTKSNSNNTNKQNAIKIENNSVNILSDTSCNRSQEQTPKQREESSRDRFSLPLQKSNKKAVENTPMLSKNMSTVQKYQLNSTSRNPSISPSRLKEQAFQHSQESENICEYADNVKFVEQKENKRIKINFQSIQKQVISTIQIMNSNNDSIDQLVYTLQQPSSQAPKKYQQPFKLINNTYQQQSYNKFPSSTGGNYANCKDIAKSNNNSTNSYSLLNNENSNISLGSYTQKQGAATNSHIKPSINQNINPLSQFTSQTNSANNQNVPSQTSFPRSQRWLHQFQQQQLQTIQQQNYQQQQTSQPQFQAPNQNQQQQQFQQYSQNLQNFCQQPYFKAADQQQFQQLPQQPVRQSSQPHSTPQNASNPLIPQLERNSQQHLQQQQTRAVSALGRDTRISQPPPRLQSVNSNNNWEQNPNPNVNYQNNQNIAPSSIYQTSSTNSFKRLKTIDCAGGSSISNRPINTTSLHNNNNLIKMDSHNSSKALNKTVEDQLNNSLSTNCMLPNSLLNNPLWVQRGKGSELTQIRKRSDYSFPDVGGFNRNR